LARLKISDQVGDWIESVMGTSAGTSLGPLLFIIQVHDVPMCIMPKFADDLVALSVGKDIESVEKKLARSNRKTLGLGATRRDASQCH